MSGTLSVWIEGIGAWMPGLPDWPAWCALLRGEGDVDAAAAAKPRPASVAAGERRRMSVHVLAAIEVADQAVAMSGRVAADLGSVFACAHGDVGIMDYMCDVLAATPAELSPTRFHNSVHNAAAGYWSIAKGCHAPAQAVTAAEFTFAAGLLEAAVQARVEARPVLLVAHDEPGSGPLAEALAVQTPFACALVLAPQATPQARAQLNITLGARVDDTRPRHADAASLAAHNPSARALALLERLAQPQPQPDAVALALSPTQSLTLEWHAAVGAAGGRDG